MSGGMRLARCEPVMGEAARVVGVEEAEVLGFALRAMADGVAIVERSGRIRFVNRALAEAWGVPVPAILGRLAGDFVRLPGSPASLDTVLAVAVRGSWRGDLGRSGPDSPRGIWEVTFSRIGETDTLVGVFRDCSEAGRLVLDRRVIDLGGVVTQAVDQLAWVARRKGLALSVESGTLPAVVADESQMERVVGNLVGNAIKYTAAGGVVRVTTGRHNGHVTVAVRDTGRGIPAHELPHLFEKYRRVRDKNRTEGTGPGLFIAQTIVEGHGGQIRVER